MGVLHLFHHGNVIELDVKILVDRFQCASYLDIVLELDGDFVVDQGLEEAIQGFELAMSSGRMERRKEDANLKKSILNKTLCMRSLGCCS